MKSVNSEFPDLPVDGEWREDLYKNNEIYRTAPDHVKNIWDGDNY